MKKKMLFTMPKQVLQADFIEIIWALETRPVVKDVRTK